MVSKTDRYYMQIAKTVASRSHCLSRRIGALIVQDDAVISTGYNGPSRGVPHCEYRNDDGSYSVVETMYGKYAAGLIPKINKDSLITSYYMPVSEICPRQRLGFKSGEGMEYCTAAHAETNAIVNAARSGVSTKGATLYCDCPTPCPECMKLIINSGIMRVVATKQLEYSKVISSEEMAAQANVTIDYLE